MREIVAKSDKITDEQKREAMGGEPSFLFGKRNTSGLLPISEGVVQETLARLSGFWQKTGETNIRSLFRAAELPQEVRDEAAKRGIPEDEIHGVLHRGHACILRQNIKIENANRT